MKTKMQHISIKKDSYRKTREGYSEILELFCHHCKTHLAFYQKDGPGALLRVYQDRLIEPALEIRQGDICFCPVCHKKIGCQTIYEKEKRPAIFLFKGAIISKSTSIWQHFKALLLHALFVLKYILKKIIP